MIRTSRIPKPGETITGHSLVHGSGGKGANQAVAAARIGADVSMIGAVGDDQAGREQLSNLAANGIRTDALMVASGPTGLAVVTVTDEGENSIIVIPGANATIGRDHSTTLTSDAVFLTQLELPAATVLAGLRSAQSAGAYTILNAAPMTDLDELVDVVDLLVVNETEAEALVQSHAALASAPSDGPGLASAIAADINAAVIITLGSAGAVLAAGTDTGQTTVVTVPAEPVDVVDTTGAGDTFVGALAATLTSPRGPIDLHRIGEAVRLAAHAAAIACTWVGAQTAMPTLADLQAAAEVV
jgi:ribokinase